MLFLPARYGSIRLMTNRQYEQGPYLTTLLTAAGPHATERKAYIHRAANHQELQQLWDALGIGMQKARDMEWDVIARMFQRIPFLRKKNGKVDREIFFPGLQSEHLFDGCVRGAVTLRDGTPIRIHVPLSRYEYVTSYAYTGIWNPTHHIEDFTISKNQNDITAQVRLPVREKPQDMDSPLVLRTISMERIHRALIMDALVPRTT